VPRRTLLVIPARRRIRKKKREEKEGQLSEKVEVR
jgi:hypothetical protein